MEDSLRILKLLHFLYNDMDLMKKNGSSLLLQDSSDAFEGTILDSDFVLTTCQASAEVDEHTFRHSKLDALLMRQTLQNPYKISTGGVSTVLTQIFAECPF